MYREDAKQKIERELTNGAQARAEGLEGRARACARRAAGAAVREYLELRGEPLPGTSAVDLLAYLQARPEVSEKARQVAGHMLLRVNEAFTLPEDIDLLAEARWLADELEMRG